MITIEQMVQREILCCMSSLVSTLAKSYGNVAFTTERMVMIGRVDQEAVSVLRDLTEQAYELAAPALDYEEAARQAGWIEKPRDPNSLHDKNIWIHPERRAAYRTGQHVCDYELINPYEWEVFEHWAVTQWFAERLIAQGERVDTDFASLNIWARTTMGQAISMDGVVQKIYREMVK